MESLNKNIEPSAPSAVVALPPSAPALYENYSVTNSVKNYYNSINGIEIY
jgi:hypothetical protein